MISAPDRGRRAIDPAQKVGAYKCDNIFVTFPKVYNGVIVAPGLNPLPVVGSVRALAQFGNGVTRWRSSTGSATSGAGRGFNRRFFPSAARRCHG